MDAKRKNTINVSGEGNYIQQTLNQDSIKLPLPPNDLQNLKSESQVQIKDVEEKLRKIKKLNKAINSFLQLRKNIEKDNKQNDNSKDDSTLKNSTEFLTEEVVLVKQCDEFLNQTAKLKASSQADPQTYHKTINEIATNTNSLIDQMGYFFSYIIYSTIGTNKFADSVVKQIGHTDLQNEAKLHLERINEIEEQIDYDNLFKSDFIFLSDKGTQTIIFCKVIEENKQDILSLFETDKKRQKKTKNIVTRTLFIIILIFVVIFALTHERLIPNLTNYRLPLINIPLSIIIWGFIGSFASMNYRFNKKPISDFGDTIKWLITRPIQGIILSSAFYLALISGLFLISESTNTGNRPEVFLFMAFLIGFSDKFVDKVFNMLVSRFVDTNKDETHKTHAETSKLVG